MPATVLEGAALTEGQVEAALLKLPLLDTTTLVLLRDLQAQITALTARVEDLEA